MYGVCDLSVIPVRATASEQSETVTQLLFGEAYQVIEETNNWYKINILDDNYEGWINKAVFNPLHYLDVDSFIAAPKFFVKELVFFITNFESNITFPIFAGSSFPYPKENMLILGNSVFIVKATAEANFAHSNPLLNETQYSLLRFAATFLEAPYLWGGRTPAGIDCSGLVQTSFKSIGIKLPRDASQQALSGYNIDFISEANPCDVAFFQNEEGKIIHTGIMISKDNIIHASGKVKCDLIDQNGIFDNKTKQYTHQLRLIKRFF